jgi:pyrimidine deaminase RibD-like protein
MPNGALRSSPRGTACKHRGKERNLSMSKPRKTRRRVAKTRPNSLATLARAFQRLARDLRRAGESFAPQLPRLDKAWRAAERVGKAWSGGWLGYQSRVYKAGLTPVKPGEFFNTTYGMDLPSESIGRWQEYEFDVLFKLILKRAGNVDLESSQRIAREVCAKFERLRSEAVATLAAVGSSDEFLDVARKRIEALASGYSAKRYFRAQVGQRAFRIGDSRVQNQDIECPPHILVQARVFEQRTYAQSCEMLASELEHIARYVRALQKHPKITTVVEQLPPGTDFEISCMDMAITAAKNCRSEVGKVSPRVGAVIARDGVVLSQAYRGQRSPGDHAEYLALDELKRKGISAAGATVFTTLEPCTSRNPPKLPCAERLIEHRVSEVWIGVLDPDIRICGSGELRLREAGIRVRRFPPERMAQIEELNNEFTRDRRKRNVASISVLRSGELHENRLECLDVQPDETGSLRLQVHDGLLAKETDDGATR